MQRKRRLGFLNQMRSFTILVGSFTSNSKLPSAPSCQHPCCALIESEPSFRKTSVSVDRSGSAIANPPQSSTRVGSRNVIFSSVRSAWCQLSQSARGSLPASGRSPIDRSESGPSRLRKASHSPALSWRNAQMSSGGKAVKAIGRVC